MANQMHIQAEKARESGDFLTALTLTDQSLVEYQSSKDYAGMAEVLCSRYLTLVHLFEKTTDNVYLTLAHGSAQDAYLVSQQAADPSAQVIPLYNLAKALEKQGDLPRAVEKYKLAIDLQRKNPPLSHNQPAVILDMQTHLGICELKNGDDTAYDRVLATITQLSQTPDEPYRHAVWLSGAHLKLAEALAVSNRLKSQEHLKLAEEIITSHPDLTLRMGQLESLKQKLAV